MSGRYITTWRRTGDRFLDWDHCVSEDRAEAETVVRNLKSQGVKQWSTFSIGERVTELSSEF